MLKIKNPTTVDLTDVPKPNVIRVNRLAWQVMLAIVAAVFIVGLLYLPSANKQRVALETNNIAANENETDTTWYQKQSNALPNRTIVDKTTTSTFAEGSTMKDANDKATKIAKMQEDDYLQALDSPLSPNGVGSENASPNNSTSSNSSNSTLNAIDSSVRKLPLTDAQIVKLAGTFGDQNMQSEKAQFLEKYAKTTDTDYLNADLKKPISPFELQAGSKIPAELETGINSDLPGQVTAIVRQNVYDTVTGKYLLIPQGSRLLIAYDSNVAYGQERVLPSVKRILFPNGSSMDLGGMPAADAAGYAGFHDQVNNHYAKIFGSAAVLAGISAGFQISQPQQSSALAIPTTSQVAAGAIGQQFSQVGTSMMNKNLNVQPTLEVRPGYQFIVNVTSDMVFPKPYEDQ